MGRTRVRVALSLAILTIPALCVRADDEDPALQDFAARYYAAKHGVDESEARARIELQDRAAGIEDDLTALLGDLYAGIWYDARDRGRLKIGLTDAARPYLDRVQDLTQRYGVSSDADVVPVRFSEAELVALQARVLVTLGGLVEAGQAITSHDTSINAVLVRALARLSATDEARLSRVASMPGVVVRRLDVPSLVARANTCHITFCNPPLRGGRQILSDGMCTAGFMARSHTNPSQLFVLTAGHCIFQSTKTWFARDESSDWHIFGNSAITQFAGGPGLDAGATTLTGPAWIPPAPLPQVVVKASDQTAYNPNYPIKSDAFSSMGQVLCRTGAWTGTHCAEVSALGADESVSTPLGTFLLHNMGELDMCIAEDGDSGGPLYKKSRAFGMHSSSLHLAPFSCFESYQGIRGAEKALGVDLLLSP
jgi:hypothetical protein